MTQFQQPYSLDAVEPASRVELIGRTHGSPYQRTKPDLVNRTGRLTPRDDKKGIGPNGTSFSAAANAEMNGVEPQPTPIGRRQTVRSEVELTHYTGRQMDRYTHSQICRCSVLATTAIRGF